jgi:hypothetical protein
MRTCVSAAPKGAKLHELADEFGVSIDRVSVIVAGARPPSPAAARLAAPASAGAGALVGPDAATRAEIAAAIREARWAQPYKSARAWPA